MSKKVYEFEIWKCVWNDLVFVGWNFHLHNGFENLKVFLYSHRKFQMKMRICKIWMNAFDKKKSEKFLTCKIPCHPCKI